MINASGESGRDVTIVGQRATDRAKAVADLAKKVADGQQKNPSWINRTVDAIRPLNLAPEESADPIKATTVQAGYKHGPRVILPDGTIVLSSIDLEKFSSL